MGAGVLQVDVDFTLHGTIRSEGQLIASAGFNISALGADPVGSSPEEFGAFIKKEFATWSKVIKEVGITIE